MKNNNKTKIYYGILFLILGVKIIGTLFANGLGVHHGKKIAQLTIQKENLQQQQLKLEKELSDKASLANIQNSYDLSEYVVISQPIVITTSGTVASN